MTLTLRARLDRYGGIGPGFDACRLALSVAVLCWHSVLTSYGPAAEARVWASPLSVPLTALMPMFFALSGFLVMGSLERARSLRSFLGLRALRIVPALATEILVSAVLVGGLLTTHPLASYVTDPLLLKYFGSLVGKVSYVLPGVFEHNPDPLRVNVSLWTIPPELGCYVFLAILSALRLGRKGLTAAAALLVAADLLADLFGPAEAVQAVVPPRLLVVSFAIGNLLYLWRDTIPFRGDLLVLGLAAGLLLIRTPGAEPIALAGLGYAIVFAGCCRIPVPYPLSTGDYSYGLYLYAFPIQQVYAALFPAHRVFYLSIAACLPVAVLAAALSWWGVERPALRAKGRLLSVRPGPTSPSLARTLIVVTSLAAYGVFLAVCGGVLASAHAPAALALAIPLSAAVCGLRHARRVGHLARAPLAAARAERPRDAPAQPPSPGAWA